MAGLTKHGVGTFAGSAVPAVAGMEDSGVTSEINVTPMIDVMLVLLIIFMVITPLLFAYEATLPEAQYVVPEPDDDVITLGIDARGVFYLENEPVPDNRLAHELQRIYYDRPGDHLLFLRADRSVGYDVVLSAIDAARAAGIRTIGAITTPEDTDSRASLPEGAARELASARAEGR
ncbi:MAG: ExbD/TolR family protein [Longimicrobiaceae bacterium]